MESPAESNHSYYNFDPVMFTLFDKAGTTFLRYHFSVGGEIREEVSLAKLEQEGFTVAIQKLANGQFPIRLKIANGSKSLHFTLRRIDRHGYIKGSFFVKIFGLLPISWSGVSVREVSMKYFVRALTERLQHEV